MLGQGCNNPFTLDNAWFIYAILKYFGSIIQGFSTHSNITLNNRVEGLYMNPHAIP